jgi:predicted transposase YbfD/YdcC
VQQWDVVIGQLSFHNGESSEITSAKQLLQQLDVKGVWITLDALHTQKNSG